MKYSVHPEPSQQSGIPSLGSEASRSIPIPSNSIAIGRHRDSRSDVQMSRVRNDPTLCLYQSHIHSQSRSQFHLLTQIELGGGIYRG